MSSTPITSKKELYDYFYDKMPNIKYWCDALGIPRTNLKSGMHTLYQIITELNKYDPSNAPINSKLLKKIEENKLNYPNFYT
jgi:hypothetical protein